MEEGDRPPCPKLFPGRPKAAPCGENPPKGFWKTLGIFFALIGPGIITSNVDNDAGGITTYSLAGSEYGLTLLWTLIPITFALIIIQEMCARMGVVSGKGLSDLIRERFGAKATFYLMIALFLTNLGNTISEFAGVAASLEIFGVSKYLSVPLSAFFVWWLVVKGSYKSVEKAFLVACLFLHLLHHLRIFGRTGLGPDSEPNSSPLPSDSNPLS